MSTDKHHTFLMLQGHPSGFWRRLGTALEAAGHRVIKVNLCAGDWAFWWRKPAINYKGSLADWPVWLRQLLLDQDVTDILYYADRLPYHVSALSVAQSLDIDCWAIEFGYLRPDWLTLEPEGMGINSLFPRDWPAIAALADGQNPPEMEIAHRHSFFQEAFGEVAFNLLMVFGKPFFRTYVSDKYHWPIIDYLSWLRVLALRGRDRRHANALSRQMARPGHSYNLVAMQLQADYQIRASSHYKHLEAFLNEVIVSFAKNATFDRHLVIKLHPLDNGLENWAKRIHRLIQRAGLRDEVHIINGGDLDALIDQSEGVIYVNSTVGLHAIQRDKPSIAMGHAIFDLPGLTHQGGLDSFWTAPEPVDAGFREVFLRALTTIQVKGSFFDRAGQNRAIATIVSRLTAPDATAGTVADTPPENASALPEQVNDLARSA